MFAGRLISVRGRLISVRGGLISVRGVRNTWNKQPRTDQSDYSNSLKYGIIIEN